MDISLKRLGRFGGHLPFGCLLFVGVVCAELTCTRPAAEHMQCTYYNHGTLERLPAGYEDSVLVLVQELVGASDDILKLLVAPDRIEEIRKTGTGLEIISSQSMRLNAGKLGIHTAKMILVPFDGEFSEGEQGPTTVFLGESTYQSGPLRQSKGRPLVRRINILIQREIGR
jgi:hypothetical protein